MFKGLKQKYENVVNRWLYSAEIKQHEQQVQSGIAPRADQNGPSEQEIRAEEERIQSIHAEQMKIILAEDHTVAPSQADINRYHTYHENMVQNINFIREKTGVEPPFEVPKTALTATEYGVMVGEQGWNGMRMSCGLPTGDLSKPKKPWVLNDVEKKWSTHEEPEIHWKTKK